MLVCSHRKLSVMRTVVCFALSMVMLTPQAAEVALALQMETELAKLGPAPVNEDSARLWPVLLGITNIVHRIHATHRDTEIWKTANQALAEHLTAREQHLDDLQVLVSRQDDAIVLLERRAQKLESLAIAIATLPAASSAVVEMPVASVAQPVVDTSHLFGVPLNSEYLAGGLLAVIAVLLAWGLGLRSRLARNRVADSVATPIAVAASMVPDEIVRAGDPAC